MTTQPQTQQGPTTVTPRWYAIGSPDVCSRLQVDMESGLTTAEATARLSRNGPNTLPVEKPPSTLRRLLGQYTSYMQLILVGAAVVSLIIAEWSTAIALL